MPPASVDTSRLDEHLRRAASRARRRRLTVVLGTAGPVLAGLGACVAALAAVGRPLVAEALLAAARLPLVLALGAGVVWAFGRRSDAAVLAREIDTRLGLDDRTSAALAVARGQVTTTLGARVVADAAATLDARRAALDTAFPSRPPRGLRSLTGAAWALVVLFALLVLASRLFGTGGGLALPGLAGSVPADAPGAPPDPDAPDGAPETPTPGAPPTRDPTPAADPPPPAPHAADPVVPDPAAEPEPKPPAGPRAAAELQAAETYELGEPVLVLAVVRPGPGLRDDATARLVVEIDGHAVRTGSDVALVPGDGEGTLTPLRLARLPGGEERLTPGPHQAVLVVQGPDGSTWARSEPAAFRVRGPEDPGPGGAPPPETQPPPTAPPPEPPPAADPEPEPQAGDPGAPDEAEPPPLPPEFQRKVVVPLFADAPEIEKTGPRLVLVPGGGDAAEPRRVPLADALDEAERRAESALDAAAVGPADRELVRRYFERLRALLEGGR